MDCGWIGVEQERERCRSVRLAGRTVRHDAARAKRLWEIKVLVEVESPEEVESLAEKIEANICPHPMDAHPEHCPTRWFMVSTRLTKKKAAKWEDLLND
jgi:hypothetical protein